MGRKRLPDVGFSLNRESDGRLSESDEFWREELGTEPFFR